MYYKFEPDYATHTGELLADCLDELKITSAELAIKIGCRTEIIYSILIGESPITVEIAKLLETALSIPAHIWNNAQAGYDKFYEQQRTD